MKDKNRIIISYAVLLLLVSVFPVPLVYTVTPDSWIMKLSMPTARISLGVASLNGKIYAIGGYKEGTGTLATNEEYDPETNLWTEKASMPTARCDFGICTWQGKIFTIGGRNIPSGGGWERLHYGVVEVYDPLSDSWETNRTYMPTPRACLRASVVHDKIYLIGGLVHHYGFEEHYNITEVYDPVEDYWTTSAPVPTVISDYVSEVVDDKIYIMGGGSPDLNQIYDPATNKWDIKATPPVNFFFATSGVTSGLRTEKRIIVVGGNRTDIYDPARDEWTAGTPMPTIRTSLGAVVVDDLLYALGGNSDDGITTRNEQYTPINWVPELPSFLILSVFMLATLLVVLAYKRKSGHTSLHMNRKISPYAT